MNATTTSAADRYTFTAISLCLTMSFLVGPGCTQKSSISTASPSPPELSDRLRDPEPLAKLPAHIPAPVGEFSMYADFQDVRDEHVVLYLINRTDLRIGFHTQDGDPYLKLEGLRPDGEWERAQPHYSSWCGNSYGYSRVLEPDMYFRILGHYPSRGKPTTVRYRVYSENAGYLNKATDKEFFFLGSYSQVLLRLISNTGPGRVKSKDIADARSDRMSLRYGSFEVIEKTIFGIIQPNKNEWLQSSLSEAVGALDRFPTDESAGILDVMIDHHDMNVRYAAIRALSTIATDNINADARFRELLIDDNVECRGTAIGTLGDREHNPKTIEQMVRILEDLDDPTRAIAICVLLRHCKQSHEAFTAIKRHINDPDEQIRYYAGLALNPQTNWCFNVESSFQEPWHLKR